MIGPIETFTDPGSPGAGLLFSFEKSEVSAQKSSEQRNAVSFTQRCEGVCVKLVV